MKDLLLILIIAPLVFNNEVASGAQEQRMADEDENKENSNETLSVIMNKFTFNLFQNLVKDSKENVTFFPLNIAKLLFAMFLGSSKTAAWQIEEALDVLLGKTKFHTELHNYFYEWANSNQSHLYKAVDKIYVSSSVHVRRVYRAMVTMFYPDTLKYIHPFATDIDAKILATSMNNTLIDVDITPDMLLLLSSVVYFKGEWNTGLKTATNETSSPNNSFFLSAFLNYRKDENCQIVELYLENRTASLLLVVPSQLENITKIMNTDILNSWINLEGFQKTQVLLDKVKIDIELVLHLEEILPKLGITDLFQKSGSLQKMAPRVDLFVNKFTQKSFIQIKPDAETGSTRAKKCGREIVVKVQAPYFFFIVDKRTKMVISAGSIIKK